MKGKYFIIFAVTIAMFLLGVYTGYSYYKNYSGGTKGIYIGLPDGYEIDKNTAIEKAYRQDSSGDWLCINVAYPMDYPMAYDTCVHECSHKAYSELYAERCEENFTGCMEDMK